jgi:hypothetical protein
MPALTNEQTIERLEGSLGVIQDHLKSQDREIREIKDDGKETKTLAKQTNGRVSELEVQRRIDKELEIERQKSQEAREHAERDEVAKRLKGKDRLWWVFGGLATAGAGSAVGTAVYVIFLNHPLK